MISPIDTPEWTEHLEQLHVHSLPTRISSRQQHNLCLQTDDSNNNNNNNNHQGQFIYTLLEFYLAFLLHQYSRFGFK